MDRQFQPLWDIQWLCLNKLSIRIDSVDADLFATGLLDSMALVQLIMELEQHFKIELPMGELDIGSFRSIREIAELVAARQAGSAPQSAAMVNQMAG
jgi:D-alanine--poly(phosphoribitol) ligase subunit 2